MPRYLKSALAIGATAIALLLLGAPLIMKNNELKIFYWTIIPMVFIAILIGVSVERGLK